MNAHVRATPLEICVTSSSTSACATPIPELYPLTQQISTYLFVHVRAPSLSMGRNLATADANHMKKLSQAGLHVKRRELQKWKQRGS